MDIVSILNSPAGVAVITALGVISHVRFNIHPDGGVSRLRLWGRPA